MYFTLTIVTLARKLFPHFRCSEKILTNERPIDVRYDFWTLTWSCCSKRCRATRLLCRLLRDPWSQCDTAGTPGVCSACTSSRCCKTYRTVRRIARICVLGAIVRCCCRRRWTPWTAPFFSGTVDQPSASCEHKAGCRRSRSRYPSSACLTPNFAISRRKRNGIETYTLTESIN